MGTRIQKEIIESEIRTTGGKQVQDDIIKVNRAIKDLVADEERLLLIKAKLENQGKKNTDEWKRNEAAIKSNKEATVKQREEIGKLNGQLKVTEMTYNQLSKRAQELRGKLNNISKEADPGKWNKYNSELRQVSTQMGKVRSGSQQTATVMSTLTKAAGFLGIGLGSVWGAFKFGKSVMESTDTTADKLARTIQAASSAWDYFKKSLASGDFSNFFSNMQKAIEAGKDYADAMDVIEDRKRSLTISEAATSLEVKKQRAIYRDVLKSYDERVDSIDKIVELEKQESTLKKNIADSEKQAKLNDFAKYGITKQIVEENLKNYEINKQLIQQADEYMKALENLSAAKETRNKLFQTGAGEAAINAQDTEIKMYQDQVNAASPDVKKFYEMRLAYGKLDKKEMDELAQLYVNQLNTESDYYDNVIKAESKKSELVLGMNKKEEESIQKVDDKRKKYLESILNEGKSLIEKENAQYEERLEQAGLFHKDREKLTEDETKALEIIEAQHANNLLGISNRLNSETKAERESLYKETIGMALENEQAILDARKQKYEQDLINAGSNIEAKRSMDEQYKQDVLTMQLGMLESEFALMQAFGMDTIELEKKIEEKKSEIRETQFQKESEYQEVRDQIRAKYNLIGLMEQQEKEEEELEDYRKAGLIKEEDYQKALLNIKLKYAVQYVELALKAFNSLSESVSNLKDAEINQIEADYDRKIKLAGDDKKKVSKLEEEKEEKIKQTRKRYADVEFAIKIAEIVASTAVGIMKGVEQMGPILGAIFAVLTAVLGATQIASANSERQKVKSLWTGGYTGKGGKYEPKGIVHADEYVVSSDELSIPAVRSFIGGVVEPMRMRRIGYSAYTQNDTKPGTGFYNGGYSGSNKQSGMSVNDVSDLKSTMKSVRNLLNHLSQNGVVSVFDENKIYEMRQRVSKQESGEALARR